MLDKIESLLCKQYKVHCLGNKFILKESSKSAKCTEASFEAKGNYLVYKFDQSVKRDGFKINTLFPFYSDGNAQSMADFIIFYQKPNNSLHAVVCNLKSDNKGNNASQITAGCNFVKFILDTLKRLYPNDFTDKDLKICKVLFSSKKLYPNNKGNKSGIINLISNREFKETFVFEHKCK